jgi:hypothetical protein
MLKIKKFICIFTFLIIRIIADTSFAYAETYYVAANGKDSNPGTASQPFLTIQKAANIVNSGDSVIVRAGQYNERVTIKRSGSANSPITFRGEGNRESIIFGGDAANGIWTLHGKNVWKTNKLAYEPYTLTADGKTVWKINNNTMKGIPVQSVSGDGLANLSRQANETINFFGITIQWWDGVEALFGTLGNTTYLRFRNGDNPNAKKIYTAPQFGAAVKIYNASYITFSNFTISGGHYAVHITGSGATNNIIENSILRNGEERVVISDGASNNIIRDNDLTSNAIGFSRYIPGDWNASSYSRVVNHNIYNKNKFLIGRTRESDTNIRLYNSLNNWIYRNVIHTGMVGIEMDSICKGHRIWGNTIKYFSAQGMWPFSKGCSDIQIYDNLFIDSEHHIRFQEFEGTGEFYVYRNRFYMPWNGLDSGKHIHFSFLRSNASHTGNVWIYHNSFHGDGWAVDVGGTSEGTKDIPNLRVINNIFSTRGIGSGGFHDVDEIANNWGGDNKSFLWDKFSLPDFMIPNTSQSQTCCVKTGQDLAARSFPGMIPGYFDGTAPDLGMLQYGASPPTDIQDPGKPPAPHLYTVDR